MHVSFLPWYPQLCTKVEKNSYFMLVFFMDLLMSCSLSTVTSQIFHTLPVSPVIQRDPVGLVSCTWFAASLAPSVSWCSLNSVLEISLPPLCSSREYKPDSKLTILWSKRVIYSTWEDNQNSFLSASFVLMGHFVP